MTREEILNMPAGREMDALIWLSLNDKPLDILTCRHIDGDVQPHAGYPLGHISPPCYSTDISSAWEVIQKMHEMKYKYTLHGHFMGSELQIATFDHQDWADANPLYKAVSDSAPLAICRAALLAVMK